MQALMLSHLSIDLACLLLNVLSVTLSQRVFSLTGTQRRTVCFGRQYREYPFPSELEFIPLKNLPQYIINIVHIESRNRLMRRFPWNLWPAGVSESCSSEANQKNNLDKERLQQNTYFFSSKDLLQPTQSKQVNNQMKQIENSIVLRYGVWITNPPSHQEKITLK